MMRRVRAASPPRSISELEARVRALKGRTLADVGMGLHAKGKVGEHIERLLGATGGSTRTHDFPDLGIELKTIPTSGELRPRESTFVCAFALHEAERAEWETSWVKRKLAHVLWVPILMPSRTIGEAVFWKPNAGALAELKADFDEIVGRIGAGQIEGVTAHVGHALQLRPKARDGRARTLAHADVDGSEPVWTVPRGFYLRASFTAAILRRS
jgi:DNA mismatch repair protein MutH